MRERCREGGMGGGGVESIKLCREYMQLKGEVM
jgi:hypothetical protein